MAATTDARTIGEATLPAAQGKEETDIQKLLFIEEMTTYVDAVQERVLAEILARNADAEYLAAKCGLTGLTGATDRATFRAKVPMVTYEDLRPHIRRIADGDRSPILTGSEHPVSELLTSSGTSGGERKLIPTVKDELGRRLLLQSLVMPVMNKYVAGLDKGSGLYFQFAKPEMATPGGLPARTVLTSLFKSEQFRKCPHDPYRSNTSPAAAVLCEDAFESTYAQMLCGLCHRRRVLRVGAAFAYCLLRAIRFLELNWEQLAADIEAGMLDQRVTDQAVREAVAGVLRRPDPELARFIRAECSNGEWAGIIPRIWPNAKYLEAIVTGSMAQYVSTLNYYGGGLPIVSTIYGSSECYFGLNLRPMCDPAEVSYTIMPNMAYFEFLPLESEDAADATAQHHRLVDLAGVEAGREYEVVVTTYGGLCRYRVGDVLRVTGFHNAAPRFRFVCRKSALLTIDVDKTDEAELQRSVERASSALLEPLGAAVLDYTSRTCVSSIPGHYVVYWELLMTTTKQKQGATATVVDDKETLERCCLEMEEALSAVYRQCRVVSSSIGPLEIRVVRPGTFEELMDYAVSHGGASIGQYKVPRCVTAPPVIQLLESHVASSHFSPTLPHWAPCAIEVVK